MSNVNYVIQNGLTVGNVSIFAGNSDIVSTGNITITGSLQLPNGTVPANVYIGTTSVPLSRDSGTLSLTGVNISGSAGTATTATYVTGLTAANVQGVIGSVSTASFPTLNQNTTGTAATVTTASQPSITTLSALTSFGTTGVNTTAQGNLTVAGNLVVQGTQTTINNTTYETTEYVNTIYATNVYAATVGNIGANVVGTGTYLTNLTGAQVTGTVASATTAQYVTGLTASNVQGVIGSVSTASFPTLNQNTTGSAATFTSTSQNSQFNSIGVGTPGSTVAGEIRATNNITAYYSSDKSLKENIQDIPNALGIVCAIGSKTFNWTDEYIKAHGGQDDYFLPKSSFGVIAQDVQAVFPQAVRTREDGTLAVDYEKLAILSFGAIKELVKRIEALESK